MKRLPHLVSLARRRRRRRGCLRTLLCLGLLWPFCLSALAQATPSFGHQAWSTEDGLPQNSVHQVLQTRDGFLWIATEGGLARFDGIRFQTFHRETEPAFASDDVSCLAEAADGSLWIGTTDGALRYADGAFSRIALGPALLSTGVNAIAPAADGSLFLLTANGLVRLLGEAAVPVPGLPADVQAVASAPDGTVWLAAGTTLWQYGDGRLTRRDGPLEAVPLALQINRSGMLARSAHGITLLPHDGTGAGPGSSPMGGGDGSPIELFHTDEDNAGLANAVLRDSAGRTWIGTNRGLFLVGATGKAVIHVEAIGSRSVLSLAEDREGDLWVGTEADGLHILRRQRFVSTPELSDQVMTALAQTADGSVWMGTRDDGLRVVHRRADGSFSRAEPVSFARSLASQFVLALAAGPRGDLWVGTLDGLTHVEGSRVQRFSSADGLPDDVIRSLLVDDDGSVWIGTRRGLVHWSGRAGTMPIRLEGLRSDLIGAMLRTRTRRGPGGASSSTLWVATLNGLSEIVGDRVVGNQTLEARSGPAVITSLAQAGDGPLWIGTRNGGLAALTATGVRALGGSALPQKINSVLADDQGSLWIGSDRGVFRVASADLEQCRSTPECAPPVTHFGYPDGMPTEETASNGHPTSLRASDGKVWFATTRGVAIVDPAHLHTNTIPPPVAIERFLVDNEEQLTLPVPHRIPFGHGSLSFDYVGLSYLAPSRVQYRYRLEGFDRKWTEAGTRRSAFYTNLPPGRYTFRVQAANNDGLWNRAGATLTFQILPPFYRRLPFYALVLAALAAVTYAVYFLRVRRLRSEFDAVLGERGRIAREIHDTLAQNFVGISLNLQLAEQLLQAEDLPGTGEQLRQTRALVQEGLEEARQSIWALRATVAQDSLPTRLSRLVERTSAARGDRGMEATVTIGGIYRPLQPALEKEVLRIAGEALANVNRHAAATRSQVTLRYERDRLHLSVVDNGRGFDPDAVGSGDDHFGLEGMRERAAGLRATLSVVSSPGSGTTVTLAVPLHLPERRKV